MIDELKNIRSGRKELRSFSIILAVASLVAAWYVYRRGGMPPVYFLILSAGFGLAALLIPKFLVPLHKLWMGLGIVLGGIVSHIVLMLVFFFAVTPIGVLARVLGKDFLKRKLDKRAKSYWEYRKDERTRNDYLRQF